METLVGFLNEIFTEIENRAMPLPWLLAVVAINGSVLALRITQRSRGEGLESEILAENYVDRMMAIPINAMIVDAKGEAVRVVITGKGLRFH
jgi:hypothetical protein